MREIDGDELLKRVQHEKIQAQVHGREFSTCFLSPGGTPSTEWWYVEDLIENAPTIEPDPEIIVCADCKHWICHDRRCGYWNHGVKPLDWCSHAERRTDG